MSLQDKTFIGFYILCGVVCLFLGIMKIIKTKERSEVTDGVLMVLVSFTPGVMLLGMIIVLVGFILIIVEGPSYLISKLKGIKS
jgi:hypothetical protein